MGCTYYVGELEFDEEGFKKYLAEGGIEKLGVKFDELKYTASEPKAEAEDFNDASNPFADIPSEEAPGRAIFDAPALVELARQLMGGDLPKISKMKTALGRVYSGSKRMLLHPDLFKVGNESMLVKVLAHEIGHIVDILGDTIKNTKIGAKIAALSDHMSKFLPFEPGAADVLSDADIARFQAEADQNVPYKEVKRKIDEEIEQEIGITPQDVIDIWNTVDAGEGKPALLEFIKGLSDAEKVAIVKQAMKGKLPPELEQFKETIKVKTGKKITVSEMIRSKASVQREFKRLMEEEIAKRKLWKEKELAKELYEFSTKTWRPVSEKDLKADPKLAKYRKDTKETFADALSALLVSPGTLKRLAPKFYEAFTNYAANHPEFDAAYKEALDLLNAPKEVRDAHNMDMLLEGFRRGRAIRQVGAELKRRIENRISLLQQFVSKTFAVTNRMKGRLFGEGGKLTKKAEVLSDVEALNNISGMQGLVLNKLYGDLSRALSPLEYDSALTIAFADRVIAGRKDIANPRGHNPESAEGMKEEAYRRLTPEQAKHVDETLARFRENVFKVMQDAYDMGLFTKEQWDTVLSNKDSYVTFTPIDYAYKSVSAGMKEGRGTLEDITDPFEQTTLKMVSIMSAAIRNKAVTSAVEGVQQLGKNKNDLVVAPPKRDANGHVYFGDAPEGKELIRYIIDGKPAGVYAPKDFADVFKSDRVEEIAILSHFNNTFKPMVTTFNLGFSLWNNPLRDTPNTIRSLVSLISAAGSSRKSVNIIARFFYNLPKGIKEAYTFASGKKITDIAEEMIRNNALYKYSFGRYETNFVGAEKELHTLANVAYGEKGKFSSNKISQVATNLFKTLELMNKFSGYQTLKDYGFEDKAAGMYTRKYAGSPDFSDKAKLTGYMNQWFPFYNVIVQGLRSNTTLAFNRETAAGYWAAQTFVSLPSILMRLGIMGYFGDELRKAYAQVDDYTKNNYVVIPLFETEDGEREVLRIPTDEITRMAHNFIVNGSDAEIKDALNIGVGLTPSLSPLLDIGYGVGTYLKTGNVYDKFRNEMVFRKDEETENKGNAVAGLGKFTQWAITKAGGGRLVKAKDRVLEAITYDTESDTTTVTGIKIFDLFKAAVGVTGLDGMFHASSRGLQDMMEKGSKDVEFQEAHIRNAIKGLVETNVAIADKPYSPEEAEKIAERVKKQASDIFFDDLDLPEKQIEAAKKLMSIDDPDTRADYLETLKKAYSPEVVESIKKASDDVDVAMAQNEKTILPKVKIAMLYGNKGYLNDAATSLINQGEEVVISRLEKLKTGYYKNDDKGFKEFIENLKEIRLDGVTSEILNKVLDEFYENENTSNY